MFALPAFLSFPFSFPALPSISLPANIQRRFLSYLLKRYLGRFIQAGGLDVERIQAQISEGWVEIEGLELDIEEINTLIPPSLPLTLLSGSLDKVTARVPFPNLWSDPLSLSLDTLQLDFQLATPSSKGKSPETTTRRPPPQDLSSSVTTAADDFLHEELDAYEEAELGQSIRQSLVLNASDPFQTDDVPGAFPFSSSSSDPSSPLPVNVESTNVLAGLLERVLARLEFMVKTINVRIHFQDQDKGGVFELRVGEIKYADESEENDDAKQTVRSIKISSVGVYLLPLPRIPARYARADSTSSAASSSSRSTTSSESYDDGAEMFMSQAVADLRQSMMASTATSGASIYQSAMSERILEDPPPRSRSRTPTRPIEKQEGVLLLSLGPEDIVLRMKTTRPQAQIPQSLYSAETPTSTRPPLAASRSSLVSSQLPAVEIEFLVGTVAGLLLPTHTATLLAALQSVKPPPSPSKSRRSDPPPLSQPRIIDARLRIKAVHLSLVYDTHPPDDILWLAANAQFWSKPSTTFVPLGHLKLRLEALETAYVSMGSTPSTKTSNTPMLRRASTHNGLRSPTITLSLSDASLFEYLAPDSISPAAPDDTPPGGAFPVFVFDPNLVKQYDIAPGAPSVPRHFNAKPSPAVFPEFEAVDWRNSVNKRAGGGEKGWKVRQKRVGIMKGSSAASEDEGAAVIIRMNVADNATAHIETQSIHVFLDLSLVERLLPMLRSLAPIIRPPLPPERPPTPVQALHTPQYVIDDLESQARTATSRVKDLFELKCPLVRLDIRCPAPISRRGTWGDGAHLRSGIVTLDIHGLAGKVGGKVTKGRREENGKVEVEWAKMILFFCRVPEKKAVAFLVVGPLAPEPSDIDLGVLLPIVEMSTMTTAVKTTHITCRIPSVQARLRQTTIQGLQFFADDMTHWLDGAFGDGSAPRPRDDLKMIGSRFFGGSKASSSASSSVVDDEDDEIKSATILRVIVPEIDLGLHVPRSDGGEERILSLTASDAEVKVESNTTGRQESTITVSIMDADFSDRSEPSLSRQIVGRTTPLMLTAHNEPLVHLRFSSLSNLVTETKETGIKVICSSSTVFINKDIEWVKELALFVKTPEGVFEDVVPSEITRIDVALHGCSVQVEPPNLKGAIVAALGVVQVKLDIVSDSDNNMIDISAEDVGVLAIDDLTVKGEMQNGHLNTRDAWKGAGFAQLVELSQFHAQVFRNMTASQDVLLDVSQAHLNVSACADSMATFGALAGDLGNLVPSGDDGQRIPGPNPTSLDQSIDVFASIDQEAFHQIPDIVSGADMIDDDLPTNLDYLDQASRPVTNSDRPTGESLRSWETTCDDARFAGEVKGETIRILMKESFAMDANYLENLTVVRSGFGDETRVGKTRVRLQDCSLTVYLHDGYDWISSRKAIEDEIKAVRRRLEKIRQLLASGQKADESIERASSTLFNSVYIGLPRDRENLDPAALLAAIDDELEDFGDETVSNPSSWQSFPPNLEREAERQKRVLSKKTRLRGKKLTRSKKPQIEVALQSIRMDLDLYGEAEQIASRIHVTVGTAEILDHIKSSTWKKFLTEMKADSRGNVRETDADMVRIELVAVRPTLPSLEEEFRFRAKVLPLRLHVDQDALDFLKRFGSFRAPALDSGLVAVSKKESREPFFQHVEIFPVELKLDYKSKRVDFAALREGRTIELMNLFQFDGAEMTLRHVTLSGVGFLGSSDEVVADPTQVTGWATLGNTLNDIWTPDVKANQLADVISGVAPIRSIVNVGSGIADLILLPIEQYMKDGQVARGVQKGTNNFVKSTAMEMMKLGAKLATGTQVILEQAEGVLGGKVVTEVEEEESDDEADGGVSRYANQPGDMKEGVQAAYNSLSKNVHSAAQTILAVPMEVYERSGEKGPLRAVVRAVPIAVLKPMIGASEAVSKTLLGMRNHLDPEGKRELGDKYK
ncbi:autophagy-related protein 2, partial [Tremellales sp. Uapishka_1]